MATQPNRINAESWRCYMTLAENLRTKYSLTSLKAGGSCLALTAINEALEAAAEIADRSHAPEIANQIRALKWEAKMPSYASENSDRERCGVNILLSCKASVHCSDVEGCHARYELARVIRGCDIRNQS